MSYCHWRTRRGYSMYRISFSYNPCVGENSVYRWFDYKRKNTWQRMW